MRPAAMSAPTSGRPSFEKHLREQVESIVSSVVGPGHSRVQVNADFDFNRITQTSDKFDPDGRVVRSSQTREETSASNGGGNNQVTVGNELPGANAASAGRRRQCRTARPEPQVGGNRQLRDLENHQDRSDRRRPRQPRLGRRPGRRHLRQGRQRRRHLSAAQQGRPRSDRERWCAPRSASTRSAATRSKSSICASPRRRPIRSTSRPAGSRRSSSPRTTSCAPSKWW